MCTMLQAGTAVALEVEAGDDTVPSHKRLSSWVLNGDSDGELITNFDVR
jgi:hypothetical protein